MTIVGDASQSLHEFCEKPKIDLKWSINLKQLNTSRPSLSSVLKRYNEAILALNVGGYIIA